MPEEFQSTFLKKIKPEYKKARSSSFSRLQSVGLSIVASVSRKAKTTSKEPSSPSSPSSPLSKRPQQCTNIKNNTKKQSIKKPSLLSSKQKQQQSKLSLTSSSSSTLLSSPAPQPSPPQPKASFSTRPVSQFFFPSTNNTNKNNEAQKKRNSAIDLIDSSRPCSDCSSSRSSSIKTIRQLDSIMELPDMVEDITIQSDISFLDSKKHEHKQQKMTPPTVARARTVFGLDTLKTKESRAIHVWKNTVSQLSEKERIESEKRQKDDDIYDILLHPALIPTPLEEQRFVPRSTAKEKAMVKFIISELLATEQSFYRLLLLIQARYMKPMIAASKKKYPLVKSSDIPLLFSHLPELILISQKLLVHFKLIEKPADIGNAFRRLEPELVVFLKYAMHYQSNIKTIRRACNNALFLKIDQETLARRDSNRLGMSDYFIAPIQRIPRYCLLLKDLQKYTHPSESDYTELNYALKTLTGLAVAMDHVQRPPQVASRNSVQTL